MSSIRCSAAANAAASWVPSVPTPRSCTSKLSTGSAVVVIQRVASTDPPEVLSTRSLAVDVPTASIGTLRDPVAGQFGTTSSKVPSSVLSLRAPRSR